MGKPSRNIIFDFALIFMSIIIAALLAEGAYRVYLKFSLESTALKNSDSSKNAVISFMNEKGAWTFDKEVGFNFRPDGYLTGRIADGEFKTCGTVKHFNSRKNVASKETDFSAADIRGVLVGSSYTMGRTKDGRFFHEIVGDILSKKLGKKVLVENYSRDRYGVIQMLDMAAVVAERQRPDFIIIAFNTATIGMPRLWRVIQPDRAGFYNLAWVNEPEQHNLTPENSLVHRYVLYDKVTLEWCDKMKNAAKANQVTVLHEDPIVRAIIERYREYSMKSKMPALSVDLKQLSTSFLFNRLIHRNAFWNIEVYKSKTNPLPSLHIDDFGEDKKFLESVKALNATGVPFAAIHIPEYPELRTGNEWESIGSGSLLASRGLSLVASLEQNLNQKVLSLLPAIEKSSHDIENLPRKSGPPNMDWHPSQLGVSVYTKIVTDLVYSRFFSGEGEKNHTK